MSVFQNRSRNACVEDEREADTQVVCFRSTNCVRREGGAQAGSPSATLAARPDTQCWTT
eukprot:CAMPEP_0204579912 /NCGR_PEP_ID=MMETSP0661-20131031/43768_1 /ASSEMBLY_ACC=CAM_ASM_000606 /TAXON_ID=109239 /ORGANISM="Alexandrium margalefi, Strain AMGDE01CS-322" /LENGTH=58 /DNA_ID=CAMNT_0051588963 /DNA_START=110 /DNA_END=282 /DNA_ORIENTATION=+